ncbi:aminotransferase class I/II-fold pyridoxal phosphate-dependent enzyme [Desulfocurvus sp.]|uniref:DegT/DnrJ/EryC1/StrS family aminotransferase n=1 Tax=Desulfocurvus sp. TaxID=2871698 RepID=UPI0025C222C5|nr:aminotransferase class I/II-fold pyridoxal phosphate-dependent enzyme [Desulfocurvus sp.]MCK9241232.1 aminotransferase class I/II-fold pyridoxal phosphate-dependent enzyme [Desulfocurvus sp.]
MHDRIFLSSPHMGGSELNYIGQAFADNYIAPVGPHIPAFEREFEAFLGQGHCVAVASGTAALHLALRLAGVGPGDEVVCSDLTFIASASPVVYQGARPVFVDADPRTWNLDLEALEAHLSARRRAGGPMPRALMLVHLYGQPCDVGAAAAICAEYGLALVEDAAESLGSLHAGRQTGTFAPLAAFSFNGNKIITCGGGGMFVAQDKAQADKARFLATQARDPAPHYQHSELGYNYRMSNLLAAVGRGQLEVLAERVEQKRALFAGYRERLGAEPWIEFMPEAPSGRANRWLTCALFGDDAHSGYRLREAVRLALEEENIESRPVWKPMHMQPVFADAPFVGPGADEELFARGLCLPSDTKMTEADLDRVCGAIRRAVKGQS